MEKLERPYFDWRTTSHQARITLHGDAFTTPFLRYGKMRKSLKTSWLPLHKNGNKTDCKNYRGICRLNGNYKILATILHNRLVKYGEEIIGDYQCGFRPGRSTTDNIKMHLLFVYFKQAYGSIDGQALFNILEEFAFPSKPIRFNKTALTVKCKILLQNIISDQFTIEQPYQWRKVL